MGRGLRGAGCGVGCGATVIPGVNAGHPVLLTPGGCGRGSVGVRNCIAFGVSPIAARFGAKHKINNFGMTSVISRYIEQIYRQFSTVDHR